MQASNQGNPQPGPGLLDEVATQTVAQALQRLASTERGLSSAQAAERLRRHGYNELDAQNGVTRR
ncbi:MAG TPA: cation-transporting P-type ATPase, partial [Polyangiales bacterium]|nr:cation-transporting P-type ATPase [Polyangiales bacterium]